MVDSGIQERVRDYLMRQISWLREQTECPFPEGPVSEQETEALASRLAEVEAYTAACQIELDALLPEWRAAVGVADEQREEIRRLSDEAERLSALVAEAYRKAASCAAQQAARVQENIGALARGRGVLRKYRVDDLDASYIDRKA